MVREVPKECAEYLVIWQFYGIFAIVCARVKILFIHTPNNANIYDVIC